MNLLLRRVGVGRLAAGGFVELTRCGRGDMHRVDLWLKWIGRHGWRASSVE